jgi:hypothetical protein
MSSRCMLSTAACLPSLILQENLLFGTSPYMMPGRLAVATSTWRAEQAGRGPDAPLLATTTEEERATLVLQMLARTTPQDGMPGEATRRRSTLRKNSSKFQLHLGSKVHLDDHPPLQTSSGGQADWMSLRLQAETYQLAMHQLGRQAVALLCRRVQPQTQLSMVMVSLSSTDGGANLLAPFPP